MPHLVQVQEHYADDSLVVVGVTEATAEEARAFARSYDLNFAILADAQEVREAWGVGVIWGSVVFLVDAEGRVVADSLEAAEALLGN